MPFVDWNRIEAQELLPGIRMRAPFGAKMMMALFEVDAGAEIPRHSHPHEQVGMVLEGKMELELGEETRVLSAGDAYVIPGDVQHAVRPVDGPCRVLDIFHPIREDYVLPINEVL